MGKKRKRETQSCPSTATINKGTRFKSAQTRSVNFGLLIYWAVAPPGRDSH